jgi:ParB family chromosome partitioning protein
MTNKKTDKYGLNDLMGDDLAIDEQTKPSRKKRPSPSISALTNNDSPVSHVKAAIEKSKKAELELVDAKDELARVKKSKAHIELVMPVTKQVIAFELLEIDTKLIDVSKENERDQSLLDEVSLSDILPGIEKIGQTEPGKLRPMTGGRYELVDGSRRLACAKILNRKYKALVGDIPDADVRALSDIDNQYKAVSYYEKAKFYQGLIDRNEYENWSQLAAAKNISTSQMSRFKACSALEKKFVKVFLSPSDMPLTYGETVAKLLKEGGKGLTEKVVELTQLRTKTGRTIYENKQLEPEEIIRSLSSSVKKKKVVKKPKIKEPIKYFSKDGKTMLKHSISSKGTTKFEIEGVEDSELNALVSEIIKRLNLLK